MKSCKKIVSCFLCIAILTSFLCVPASANDGIAGAAQDFFEWSVNWSQGIQDSFWKAIYGDSWMEDETDGWTGADRDELAARYSEYVSSLQTDLGTTTLIDGGVRLYFPLTSFKSGGYITVGENCAEVGSTAPYVNAFLRTANITQRETAMCSFYFGSVVAPFSGSYQIGYSGFGSAVTAGGEVEPYLYKTTLSSCSAGATVHPALNSNYIGMSHLRVIAPKDDNDQYIFEKYFTFGACTYADFYPLDGSNLPTGQDITINSRPTSIVGDYGIIGDDGTIIKVDGNMIVDESTNTVFNPVTNVTNNYTDYAFDYSDRSYNLTLEDGSTLKVVYGDENVTIQEGDTIYNIYYLIPDDSGSGDDPGTGETPGGEDLSWWKEAWTNFTDKLFSILGNGGSSVNPDTAPAVPDDEETGEKGYSVIDLFVVLKDGTWAFITGIVSTAYDGFTGFVESVSSAGSFFTFYDEESEDGILFVPLEGGETIWD